MQADLVTDYATSNRRLFLLDYDGTLADLMPTPPEAAPTPQLLTILRQLAADIHNTVVIVSGRKHEELEAWLGHLSIYLVAEHGLLSKTPNKAWHTALHVDLNWKPNVQQIMQSYATSVPGAFVEEKTAALVWHYGAAKNLTTATRMAQELTLQLGELVKANKLRALKGNKVVEIQPKSISKATTVHNWLTRKPWDFVLGAGDDTTDEDLFEALPSTAWSIKVGKEQSAARMYLPTPNDLRKLLESLIAEINV